MSFAKKTNKYGFRGGLFVPIGHAGPPDTTFGPGVEDPVDPVDPTPTPDPEPTNFWSLEGDPTFNKANLTTEQQLWFDRAVAAGGGLPGGRSGRTTTQMLAHLQNVGTDGSKEPTYSFAREGGELIGASAFALRATGYLGFLDGICDILDVFQNRLQGPVTQGGYTFRYFPDYNSLQTLDECIHHGWLALAAYACHINRTKTSPGKSITGKIHNYAEQADFWKVYLRDDLKWKWWSGDNGSNWNFSFNGGKFGSSSARTAKDGTWPWLWRSFRHSTWVHNLYYVYMYLLTGDVIYKEWRDKWLQQMIDNMKEHTDGLYAYTWGVTEGSLNGPVYGGADDFELLPSTYTNYIQGATAHHWAEGLIPDVTMFKATGHVWKWMPLGGYTAMQNDPSVEFGNSMGGGTGNGDVTKAGLTNSSVRTTQTQGNLGENRNLFLAANLVHPESLQLAQWVYDNVSNPDHNFLPINVMSGLIAQGASKPIEDSPTLFDYSINTNWNTSKPTLRDGTVLSGEALTAYQGIQWYMVDPDVRGDENYGSTAAKDDSYVYGRTLQTHLSTLLVGLQATGDPLWLDEFARLTDIMYTKLAVGWRDYDPAYVDGGGSYQHPYKCWVYRHGEATNPGSSDPAIAQYFGTDYHLDTARTHVSIVAGTRAFEANRGIASPKGYNYGALADKWKTYLWDEFRHVWSGHMTEDWVTQIDSYAGQWRASPNARPELGQYPLFDRQHLHTSLGMNRLHYHWGKLFGEDAALSNGITGMHELTDKNLFSINNSKYGGTSITWPRTLHFIGHDDNNYHHPTTYARNVFADLIEVWLDGGHDQDIKEVFFKPAWKQLNWRVLNRSISSGSSSNATAADMNDQVVVTGVNAEGNSLQLIGSSGFSGRTNKQWALDKYQLSLAFDTDDGHGEAKCRDIFNNAGIGSLSQPEDVTFPLGLILKLGGARDWNP